MKELKVYLAGAMSGLTFEEMNDWRVSIKKTLEHMADYQGYSIHIINPVDYYNMDNPQHQSEREIMMFDLNHVKTSDLIVVNLENLSTSIGTIIELYEAYKNDIPVIGFNSCLGVYWQKLHPWTKECITRHHNTIDEVTEYIKDFYLS